MRIVMIVAALAVAGCAARVTGNSKGGIMPWLGINEQKAFEAAQSHCAQFGKDARISQIIPRGGGSVTFDCI